MYSVAREPADGNIRPKPSRRYYKRETKGVESGTGLAAIAVQQPTDSSVALRNLCAADLPDFVGFVHPHLWLVGSRPAGTPFQCRTYRRTPPWDATPAMEEWSSARCEGCCEMPIVRHPLQLAALGG